MSMELLERGFEERLNKALGIIKASGYPYLEIGVFGSYSRGDFNGLSDIDLVAIVDEIPPRRQTAELRSDLDEIKCDFAVLLKSSLDSPKTVFASAVKRNYRRVL